MFKNKAFYFLVLLVLILLGIWAYLVFKDKDNSVNNTTDSTIGTTTALDNSDSGWLSYKQTDLSFDYPADLGTIYIHAVDWPPKMQIATTTITCVEAGDPTQSAGQTKKKNINGTDYCVTIESEGAAGSIYNNYAYEKQVGEKAVVMTFTTRMVQCDNYDDPQKTECKNERNSFNIDTVVDKIMSTLKLN